MKTELSPLAVDLDGSLVRTDLIYETFVRALFAQPWLVFVIPFWLFKGIAYLKHQLALRAEIDYSVLPYNKELVAFLNEQKEQGRELILCTGSHRILAEGVADHFGFFTEVFATEGDVNLTGTNKAKFLVENFGEQGFSYVGNEPKDCKVWAVAKNAVVVHTSKVLISKAKSVAHIEASFAVPKPSWKVVLKAVRIHQWTKNMLLFVPLAAAHQLMETTLLMNTVLSFIAFGLCASATYLINDLSDLDSDRGHWKKQNRPLASGALTIKGGIFLCAVLMLASIGVSILLPIWFFYVLCVYVAVTLGYSFVFKRQQTIDIVVLAGLYTTRLFAGGAAAGIFPSFWLLGFSMFVFLCLAIVKRISEILRKADKGQEEDKISGRGYFISDLNILTSLGSASAMVSILVFAMYVNSPDVIQNYQTPMILWSVCPLFGYWIVRMMIMASRMQIDEDPISFALKDRRSWVVGAILVVALVLASVVKI